MLSEQNTAWATYGVTVFLHSHWKDLEILRLKKHTGETKKQQHVSMLCFQAGRTMSTCSLLWPGLTFCPKRKGNLPIPFFWSLNFISPIFNAPTFWHTRAQNRVGGLPDLYIFLMEGENSSGNETKQHADTASNFLTNNQPYGMPKPAAKVLSIYQWGLLAGYTPCMIKYNNLDDSC